MHATITPVRVGAQEGYVFRSAAVEGLCFVPGSFVKSSEGKRFDIDLSEYVVSGWARWNALLNPTTLARRLFPDPEGPLQESAGPHVIEFVHRLRAAYSPERI